MGGLDLIKKFREVALRRNFSRAVTSLGLSKATVSRYVAELEQRTGVRLLHRSTRSLGLTDAAEVLLERSAQLVEIAESTLSDLQAHGASPRGRLRMSAPHGMIAGWLSDVIALLNPTATTRREGADVRTGAFHGLLRGTVDARTCSIPCFSIQWS
jgi:DNA-binding transcriptional LysR family regulator